MYGQGLHTVFVDANILYSRTLRDWLFLMGMSDVGEIYRVRWSEDVLIEALYRLRRDHPEWHSSRIEDVRGKIERHFAECKVSNFAMDDHYDGEDRHDNHVHSAAVACRADIILTADKGFATWWQKRSDESSYEVQDPDSFFCLIDDSAPDIVVDVVRQQSSYWARHRGEARLVESLRAARVPDFAERIKGHVRQIALHG